MAKIVDVEAKGMLRVIFLFDILSSELKDVLPESLDSIGDKLLMEANFSAGEFSQTGALAYSMRKEIDLPGLRVRVGPTAEHGPYVSLGTKAHWIGANIQVAPGIWRFIRTHPGTEPNPYLEQVLLRVTADIPEILKPFVIAKIQESHQKSLSVEG